MRNIYHLKVGNAEYTPTQEELDQIVDEFKKPIPTYGVPLHIAVYNGVTSTCKIIVAAGSPEWQPTEKELQDLTSRFASQDVVATRSDVVIDIIDFSPRTYPAA